MQQNMPNQNGVGSISEMELIFQCTQDALFLIREENDRYIYLMNNHAHEELTGFCGDSFRGRTPCEVLGLESGKLLERYCRNALAGNCSVSFEETLVLKGIPRRILTKLTPHVNHESEIYLIGSRVDVTYLKDAMEEKDETVRNFKALFHMHSAVMLLIDPETGAIVDANPAACRFYGYSMEELRSMIIDEINSLGGGVIHERRMQALRQSQEYFLFPHRLKSGEVRLVDVYSCPVSFSGKSLLYSIIVDVTERVKSKEALFQEKELLNITLNSIGDGVVTTDPDGRITSINLAAELMLGYQREVVEGHMFSEVFRMKSEVTGEPSPDVISYVLKTREVVELTNHTLLQTAGGNYIPIADSAAPILNRRGEVFGAVMVFRDVSEEKRKKNEILYISYHDSLTGLYNRRYVEEQFSIMDCEENYPIAVLMGDVNGLKLTNDVFGHEYGDKLLKMVAGVLGGILQTKDVAVRWGGDEFVILLPCTQAEKVEFLIERYRQELYRKKLNEIIDISISFGYGIKTLKDQPLDAVLTEAEEMMYRTKMLETKSLRSSIVNTILATLYENSSETREHTVRLDEHCLEIARRMQLNTEKINELKLLSVLHDIGKVGIPQHILSKPGPLNKEEWVEMKRHSEIGYRIALNIPELTPLADYILHHHEKWDGSGYPAGLRGEGIPEICRILAVVDAYDAMTNQRCYREPLPRYKVISELSENSGSQFDPEVIQIFLDILKEEQQGE